MHDLTTLNSSMQDHYGTTRWMSLELMDVEIQSRHRTKYSDCYTLGIVIYKVLSGLMLFYQCTNWSIPAKVVRGDRPGRPEGVEGVWFTDGVWEALKHCWVPQPKNRWSVEDVLQCLEGASRSWVLSPPRQVAVPSTINSPVISTFEITTEQSVSTYQGGFLSPFCYDIFQVFISIKTGNDP